MGMPSGAEAPFLSGMIRHGSPQKTRDLRKAVPCRDAKRASASARESTALAYSAGPQAFAELQGLKPLEGWGAINGTAPRKKRGIFEKPCPDNTSVQKGKRAVKG